MGSFRDAYLYALSGGRCQACNERFSWARILPLRAVNRLIGSRRLATYEMDVQHIWPQNAWGPPPSRRPLDSGPSSRSQIPIDSIPRVNTVLNAPHSEAYWPILEDCDIDHSRSWVNHHHNLVLVCHAHNTSVDAATRSLRADLAEATTKRSPRLTSALESQLLARISRFRRIRNAANWSHRLCGLGEIRSSEWTTLARLFQRCMNSAEEGLASYRAPTSRCEPRDSHRAHVTSSRHSRNRRRGSSPSVEFATLQILRDFRSRFPSELARRSCTVTDLDSGRQQELLHYLVWLRHILRAHRFVSTERALGVRLHGALSRAVEKDDLSPDQILRSIVRPVSETITASFLVENSIDTFLLWLRAVAGVALPGWRQSSLDDTLHLVSLAKSLRRTARFFDHLAYGIRPKRKERSRRALKSPAVADYVLPPGRAYFRAATFMARCNVTLIGMRLRLLPEERSLRHVSRRAIEILEQAAARINSLAATDLQSLFFDQVGRSVLTRVANLSIAPGSDRTLASWSPQLRRKRGLPQAIPKQG